MPPSPELVERVRDLYHKRVPDVRFLIPVINGLEKVPLGSSAAVPAFAKRRFQAVLHMDSPVVALERGHPGSSQADQAQPHRGQRGVQPPAGHSAQ